MGTQLPSAERAPEPVGFLDAEDRERTRLDGASWGHQGQERLRRRRVHSLPEMVPKMECSFPPLRPIVVSPVTAPVRPRIIAKLTPPLTRPNTPPSSSPILSLRPTSGTVTRAVSIVRSLRSRLFSSANAR